MVVVPDSDGYRYKLRGWPRWRIRFAVVRAGGRRLRRDMNIAPADEDVFDPEGYVGRHPT